MEAPRRRVRGRRCHVCGYNKCIYSSTELGLCFPQYLIISLILIVRSSEFIRLQHAFFSISYHAPLTPATPIELVFIMGVSELIDSINLATRKSSELKDEDRRKLLNACGKLQSSLEGPRDKLMKMIFSVSIHCVHISKWFLTKF